MSSQRGQSNVANEDLKQLTRCATVRRTQPSASENSAELKTKLDRCLQTGFFIVFSA